MAERLREAIGRSSVVAANHVGELVEIRYTVSCGITRVLIEENALNKAVQRADHALYEAKDSGRNKVVNSSAS